MRMLTARLLLAAIAVSGWTAIAPADDEDHFTHGPILGRLSAHGIGVWGRTVRPMSFYVKYGTAKNDLTRTSKTITT
ncbi:MAG: hypothetical protein ACE5KM_23345, partial [Planctomycetaceae bacterium]